MGGTEQEGLPGQCPVGGGRGECAARACQGGVRMTRSVHRSSTHTRAEHAIDASQAKYLLVHSVVLPPPGLLHVQIAPLLLREQLVLRA